VALSKTGVTLALIAFLSCAVAQDKPEKKPKDQAEYDLITSIDKQPTPAERLARLEKWSKDYPASDFADVRLKAYLITYQQMNRTKDAFSTATEMLKGDPNDVLALTTILSYIYAFNPPSAQDLDTAEKACTHMIGNLDAIYAPNKKPADKSPDQWEKLKPDMKVFAQRTIGYIYLARKDNERAEAELTKALQLDPNQGQVSAWLAGVVLAQNKTKPEKQQFALFHYARAASYEGPGSLPAANRQQIQTFLTRAYKQYHGSDDGLDKLLATAKTNALPPADFSIKDIATIKREEIEKENAARAANPMMALWTDLKTGLTGENGQAYFDEHVKDAALPKFKGTIVSMTPAIRPKELILAIEKAGVADCTLKLDEGQSLPGKMEKGSEIEFEGGVGTAFTKEPFMVVLTIDKAKIAGWTGRNTPTPKKTVAKKKA